VFCHKNDFVQAPEVLPYLRTPSLYYAPEPLRGAYEPLPDIVTEAEPLRHRWRRHLHPIELRRRMLDRRHIRNADIVVTHSRHTVAELRRIYGVAAELVHLGVDSEVFTPSGNGRGEYVLSVGALAPLKGHQFVIRALATLAPPRPKLVVVGDWGPSEAEVRSVARAEGVDLELRRDVPLGELAELYRRAGVVACGQVREPFGLVPLEAMASRTPVVAVREGGFLETVIDGETGLLAPRDPAAFGQAVAGVLSDRALAERLGARGREVAVERWRWEATVRGYDALLERLVSRA
jgi:glycosyltransferase involved in cell wall biosynthesis